MMSDIDAEEIPTITLKELKRQIEQVRASERAAFSEKAAAKTDGEILEIWHELYNGEDSEDDAAVRFYKEAYAKGKVDGTLLSAKGAAEAYKKGQAELIEKQKPYISAWLASGYAEDHEKEWKNAAKIMNTDEKSRVRQAIHDKFAYHLCEYMASESASAPNNAEKEIGVVDTHCFANSVPENACKHEWIPSTVGVSTTFCKICGKDKPEKPKKVK